MKSAYGEALSLDFGAEPACVGAASIVRFMAYTVVLSPDGVHLGFEPKYFDFAITGNVEKRGKYGIEPFHGIRTGRVLKSHVAELIGHVHSWMAIDCSELHFTILVIVDILHYVRNGFDLSFVFCIWQAVQLEAPFDEIVGLSFSHSAGAGS